MNRSVEDSGAVDPAHWSDYYRVAAGAAPRAPLMAALARFDAEPARDRPRLAIDLGCGGGTDTVELLRRGWRVIAIDATPQAMQVLLERPDLLGRERLETVVGLLESTTWPTADLVNASLVLPFLPPRAVAATWERIIGSSRRGDASRGHFFGDRVSGVNLPVRSRQSRAEVLTLLQQLDLQVFDEIERDGQTAQGHPRIGTCSKWSPVNTPDASIGSSRGIGLDPLRWTVFLGCQGSSEVVSLEVCGTAVSER